MKSKKLNWQGILVGLVLCAVLAVLIGGKAVEAQTGTAQKVLQRPATVTDVYEKTANTEARIAAMEERLIRIEEKVNELLNGQKQILKNIDRVSRQIEK